MLNTPQIITKTIYAIAFTSVLSASAVASSDDAYGHSSHHQSSTEYWEKIQRDSNEKWKDAKHAFRDGWMESKLETAILMSEYLNPFAIDIKVRDGLATLSGKVKDEMVKDHATLVAKSIDGIDKVKNMITVEKNAEQRAKSEDDRRSFLGAMSDATITTQVKTAFLMNGEVEGLAIDVDTYRGQVTLSGEVTSRTEKVLAEYIARDNDDVQKVINKLTVKS